MKLLFFLLLILSFTACKNDRPNPEDATDSFPAEETETSTPSLSEKDLLKEKTLIIKRENLLQKEDERETLGALVTSKSFFKDEDLYVIDFKYPHLNEAIQPGYRNFNEFLEKNYMNIIGVEAGILEDKELLCDTIPTQRNKEKRTVDYKMNTINEKLISVLFYKENYYSNSLHPTYSFDCFNYDLTTFSFMNYESFFNTGSEEEVKSILNEVLTEKINSGEIYYDCWEITTDDFFEYKNNFVVNDTYVEYYFDDCVICPSYTGTYSVRLPLTRLLPVLKKYKTNPLL